MNIFFTADNHFGHDNIRKYCNRPFDTVEEMNQAMIERWNSVIGPTDLVYVLGDFAWERADHYTARLAGHKILIAGNHDKTKPGWLQGFDGFYSLLDLTIEKQALTLCHYPLLTWDRGGNGAWMLHGHSHGTLEEMPNVARCDVGVDVWDHFPVHWEDVQKKMATKHLEKGPGPHVAQARRMANLHANREIFS